ARAEGRQRAGGACRPQRSVIVGAGALVQSWLLKCAAEPEATNPAAEDEVARAAIERRVPLAHDIEVTPAEDRGGRPAQGRVETPAASPALPHSPAACASLAAAPKTRRRTARSGSSRGAATGLGTSCLPARDWPLGLHWWSRSCRGVTAVFPGHYHGNAGGICQNLDVVVSSAIRCQLSQDTHRLLVIMVTAGKIVHRYCSLGTLGEKGIEGPH
uniref:Uncharacterized protein n=1 Tax=Suricata suricatta TaxID=37032 RepID=A0A673TXE4_SURSU